MKKRVILFLLTAVFLAGCNQNPIEKSTSSSIDDSSSSTDSFSSSELSTLCDVLKYDDEFYNPETDVSIKAYFTNQSIIKLQEYGHYRNEKSDIYHPCTLEISINGNTTVYENVGARMKGNTSRAKFVNNDGTFYGRVHFKFSFNQLFEDNDYFKFSGNQTEQKNRRFYGAKKFDVKWNKNYDGTYTKEAYANYILENEGLLVSKAKPIKLTVIDETDSYTDYYLAMESVDKEFLKRRLESKESKGNLYKGSWPCDLTSSDSIGIEDVVNGNYYTYDLKTNDDDPDHSLLKNLINVVKSKSTAEEFKNQIEGVVDINYWLKYSALMWVIGNPDDLRYNRNNTYYYFNSKNNLMYPIPYDNDRCFGIYKDWKVDLTGINPSSSRDASMKVDGVTCPLFYRTCIESKTSKYKLVDSYHKTYLKYVKEYANKYLNVESFEAFTKQFKEIPTSDISNAGDENISFEKYCNTKLKTIK